MLEMLTGKNYTRAAKRLRSFFLYKKENLLMNCTCCNLLKDDLFVTSFIRIADRTYCFCFWLFRIFFKFILYIRYMHHGVRWMSRNICFAKDVAQRWASNHGLFPGNYRDLKNITPGDGLLHGEFEINQFESETTPWISPKVRK